MYGKSVNKVCIWILNYHLENRFKTEAFWFVFKSICYNIFTNFPKKNLVVGGKQKRANLAKILLRYPWRVDPGSYGEIVSKKVTELLIRRPPRGVWVINFLLFDVFGGIYPIDKYVLGSFLLIHPPVSVENLIPHHYQRWGSVAVRIIKYCNLIACY